MALSSSALDTYCCTCRGTARGAAHPASLTGTQLQVLPLHPRFNVGLANPFPGREIPLLREPVPQRPPDP